MKRELPDSLGSLSINWITSGGFCIAAYYVLDLESSEPLCPGNSILTGNGWEYITNAPTEEGACDIFPTLTDAPEVGHSIAMGS